ncbi:MAG: histidine kinase dimerization/phospho-acceptor domain-containing protein [Saprospiraceae bacterium]
MKKIFSLLTLLIAVSAMQAQYKVQFILEEQTTIKHDSIYIVGTFNNWDSLDNKDYLMKPLEGNQKTITLNLEEGPIKYKFHRGNWLKVEKHYNNREVPDREVYVSQDTILMDSVQGWRDEIFKDKKVAFAQQSSDSLAISILADIARMYTLEVELYNVDSAFHFTRKAIDVLQNSTDAGFSNSPASLKQLFNLKNMVASLMHSLGNYPKALEIRLENVSLAERIQDKSAITYALVILTDEYDAMKDYESSLLYIKRAENILPSIDNENPQKNHLTGRVLGRISESYYNLGKLDSALIYAVKWQNIANTTGHPVQITYANLLLGNIYQAKGELETALNQYEKTIMNAPDYMGIAVAQSMEGIAKVYRSKKEFELALKPALEAMNFFQNNRIAVQSWGENTDTYIAELSPLIADLYKQTGKPDSAYHYLQLSIALKDSLYTTDKIRQFQTLSFNETLRRQQLEQQKKEAQQQFENRMKIFGLIGIVVAALIFAFIQIRNNRQKQKANNLLQEQKKEIEQTLQELKNTQTQLIQSEKLASLGELTAGIAHEIQNPLNFVNNFSELSVDLIKEIQEERQKKKDERDEVLENELLDDLASNQQKINHHGKRASSIVTGMLQHARTSTGTKEPTDLNALADEYLRLSYHGLRAKDSTFNAKMVTDFDPTIGKVEVVPQDIGRVFLNIINNAFYAVQVGATLAVAQPTGEREQGDRKGRPYEPTVSVSSKKKTITSFSKSKTTAPASPMT